MCASWCASVLNLSLSSYAIVHVRNHINSSAPLCTFSTRITVRLQHFLHPRRPGTQRIGRHRIIRQWYLARVLSYPSGEEFPSGEESLSRWAFPKGWALQKKTKSAREQRSLWSVYRGRRGVSAHIGSKSLSLHLLWLEFMAAGHKQ